MQWEEKLLTKCLNLHQPAILPYIKVNSICLCSGWCICVGRKCAYTFSWPL